MLKKWKAIMAAEETISKGTRSIGHQITPETLNEGAKKEDQSSQVIPEKWEPPLTEDECTRLQELGLGIAVNITEKHSWGKKSVYQAKEVNNTKHLIVINESNQFKKYHEVVESYSEVQTALKSSFRPSPNTPIDVTIAADYHRSYTNKKSMKGETVLTRTVAFRMNDPLTRAAEKEVFEVQLNAWLHKSNSIRKGGKTEDIPEEWKLDYKPNQPSGTERAANDGKEESNDLKAESNEGKEESFWYYHPETNHACLEYLRALGGITHYVSSVTLGATRYQVATEKLLNLSHSQSAGIRVDKFAGASVTSSRKKNQFVSKSKTEAIGRVPPFHEDGKTKKILPFRTKDEAVVRCSFTSLSNLVTHPHLQKELEAAIQEYIDSRLHGTRGPYHIATAEEQPPSRTGGTRGRLYWRVYVEILNGGTLEEEITHRITCTKDRKKASNFYLKPFEEKYFFIATDREDPRTANQLKAEMDDLPKSPVSQSATDSEISQSQTEDHSTVNTTPPTTSAGSDSSTPKQPVRYTRDMRVPQRFVCMKEDGKLSAEIVVDKKTAAFKLKNPHNTKLRNTLSKSQWLPEAALGSTPYFIHLRGSSPRHKSILQVKREPRYAGRDQEYTISCSPDESITEQLYILEPGHRT